MSNFFNLLTRRLDGKLKSLPSRVCNWEFAYKSTHKWTHKLNELTQEFDSHNGQNHMAKQLKVDLMLKYPFMWRYYNLTTELETITLKGIFSIERSLLYIIQIPANAKNKKIKITPSSLTIHINWYNKHSYGYRINVEVGEIKFNCKI